MFKTYTANGEYLGGFYGRRPNFKKGQTYSLIIDEHPRASGGTILALRRKAYGVGVMAYYDNWKQLEQDWILDKAVLDG